MEKWFTKRRKDKVLEIADRQMTLAIETVIELEKSINAASKSNKEAARASFEKLSLTEHEIDELRRTVFEELTRGSLPSRDREDIMHLVKRLDEMADHVKDASRAVIILLDAKVVKEMWEQFAETAKALLLKHSKKMDAATLLVLKDLIEEMEHVADSCDDTADYVRILTVAR